MDVLFQRAKSFASEAAKRSQDLAKEAAKLSQEIALETAKRSKELAVEASRKADQWKALAGEITPSMAAVTARSAGAAASTKPSEQELAEYGITSELREFVDGLTINTFQDFPPEVSNLTGSSDVEASKTRQDLVTGSSDIEASKTRQDLTEWQERHAVLVLKTVPEISHFRYVLCPRHMKESRFWKIYFTLVRTHVAPYEAQATLHADAVVPEQDGRVSAGTPAMEQLVDKSETLDALAATSESAQKNPSIDDQDLDAYLMGALGSSDGPDADDDDDDGFDADFDQLVNSTALESDTEEERNDSKMSRLSSSAKVVAASEGSSDGELVEIPSDLDTQSNISKADEAGL